VRRAPLTPPTTTPARRTPPRAMPARDALALRDAREIEITSERPPPRARVVVRDETGVLPANSPRRFLWPIESFESVLDVRRAIRRVIFGANVDSNALSSADVALDVDGYALVDECACARVVRDGDVVTATATTAVGSRGDVGIGREDDGLDDDVWRKPLAPDVSDEEGEDGVLRNSRSARRKSRKRAKRRAEHETAEDARNESASGEGEGADEDEKDSDGWRREKKTRLIESGTTARRPYVPVPPGDYPAKPKPLRPEDYVHIGETCHADPASRVGVLLERRRQHEAAVRASGANAWEMFVFRSEMPDEEVEEFPLVTSLKRSDFIAYKIHHGSGVKSPYYQGRVMEFNPSTRVVRVKPAPNERADEAGRLHFSVRLPQPAPFRKLGELEEKWNPFDDDDSSITDVRLIGGRSVWEGDVPSKTWTSGRTFTKPPGWQPGQSETKEQYEEWLDEHIEIHRYQMANSRKWDEEIAERAREFRRHDNSGRRRPHRHERGARQHGYDRDEIDNPENNDDHIWPTSAEELQARLLAEWNASQETAPEFAAPTQPPPTTTTTVPPPPARPGGLPPRILGVESTAPTQPPPPPGSPPPEPASAPTTRPSVPSATTSKSTRRRARASTAAAIALFRDAGDIA